MNTEKVEQMLEELRALRDAETNPEMRHYFNDAADRLDVLCSKLTVRQQVGDSEFEQWEKHGYRDPNKLSNPLTVQSVCPRINLGQLKFALQR